MVTGLELDRHEIEKMKATYLKVIAEQLITLNKTMEELNENINYLTPLVDLIKK